MKKRMMSEFASDRVEQELFKWIVTGRVRAGDRLPALEQLSAEFGVGYDAVSRAVGRLQARRLVRVDPGEGVFVVALVEVAGLDLLWPLLQFCDEHSKRLELKAQFFGFLRPLLSEWAERAASTRSRK